MSQGLPKSARDLLARQVAADEHPSADLLNGYVEQSLTAGEMAQVMNHLAACGECREIVFLANTVKEEDAVPAVAAAVPARQDEIAAMTAGVGKPRWPWWKWAMPAFAVVVLAVGGLLERDRRLAAPHHDVGETVAMNHPAPTTALKAENNTEPESAPSPSARRDLQITPAESKQRAMDATRQMAKTEELQRDEKEAAGRKAMELAMSSPSAKRSKDKAVALSVPNAVVIGVPSAAVGGVLGTAPQARSVAQPPPAGAPAQTAQAKPPAPAVQADTADLSTNFNQSMINNQPNGGNDLTYMQQQSATLKSGLAGSNEAGAASVAEAVAHKKILLHAQWRITSDGHLERALPGAPWTRVLSDQPTVFRVIATIGVNVWAGGNNGALYHSVDQGASWTKVALSSKGQTEQGTITSIRFNTPQQGSVGIDSGATWVTSDGGLIWIKQ